jgi:hypothetical protein
MPLSENRFDNGPNKDFLDLPVVSENRFDNGPNKDFLDLPVVSYVPFLMMISALLAEL